MLCNLYSTGFERKLLLLLPRVTHLLLNEDSRERSAVASGGQGGKLPPPPPVDPDKSSLWIKDFHYSKDLFSLDSVILIVVTCSRLPFSWPGNRLVQGVCKW